MRIFAFLPLCAAVVLTGCNRESAAERERAERSNALFAEAMAAESNGNAAGAEQLYLRLLQENHQMASAHLNLALLLQDVSKDYLGAVHHYQTYLDLEPASEKGAMVRDRLASAKELLARQMAADIVEREQRALRAECDALRAEATGLKRTIADLNAENAAKVKEVSELKVQLAQLRKLLETMRAEEETSAAEHEAEVAAARKAAEEAKARGAEDSDALIDAIKADALRMIEEPDGGQSAPPVDEATRSAVQGVQDEAPLEASPKPGHRYTVRPGDTLSRLAREAYGNAALWGKIQEANRSSSNPDGRLRAGETILIP